MLGTPVAKAMPNQFLRTQHIVERGYDIYLNVVDLARGIQWKLVKLALVN